MSHDLLTGWAFPPLLALLMQDKSLTPTGRRDIWRALVVFSTPIIITSTRKPRHHVPTLTVADFRRDDTANVTATRDVKANTHRRRIQIPRTSAHSRNDEWVG